MTAEELRQRLDGAKERMSSQPRTEQRSQTADSGEQQGSSGEGEERGAGGRQGAGREEGWGLVIFPNLAFTCYYCVYIAWVKSLLMNLDVKQHCIKMQCFRIGHGELQKN